MNESVMASIHEQILRLTERVSKLDAEKAEILAEIKTLQGRLRKEDQAASNPVSITSSLSSEEKISLFMDLFRGRDTIFPKRWDNQKTGKSGYSPACHNEWVKGVCKKPQIKCSECLNQAFIPVTKEVVRNHLSKGNETIGIYPMLKDETCWFLAVDFDKEHWRRDAVAYLETCRFKNVPACLEKSRSGNGGHVWIFFSEPIAASEVRKMGASLLTETTERYPEIGFESYDRFFPNQDTMPTGGFGNLIALPLQRQPRENGNSVFLDEHFEPYADPVGVSCIYPTYDS